MARRSGRTSSTSSWRCGAELLYVGEGGRGRGGLRSERLAKMGGTTCVAEGWTGRELHVTTFLPSFDSRLSRLYGTRNGGRLLLYVCPSYWVSGTIGTFTYLLNLVLDNVGTFGSGPWYLVIIFFFLFSQQRNRDRKGERTDNRIMEKTAAKSVYSVLIRGWGMGAGVWDENLNSFNFAQKAIRPVPSSSPSPRFSPSVWRFSSLLVGKAGCWLLFET